MTSAEKNYRDEDFYKCFSKIYTDITLTEKAPWMKGGVPDRGIAYNPKSGVIFKGVNSVILEMRAAQKGYKDSRWLTLDEINKLGIKIRSGEVATPIAYVNKFSPPVDVHPGTGERFSSAVPRQRYYFTYNIEQLRNCELSRGTDFIISKNLIREKAKNAIENAQTTDIRVINDKLIKSVVKNIPKDTAALAISFTQYRLAQEFHIPYKPVLNSEQISGLKREKMTVDSLLRTAYQCEVSKDRLLSRDEELERGVKRTVERTTDKEQNRHKVTEIERD